MTTVETDASYKKVINVNFDITAEIKDKLKKLQLDLRPELERNSIVISQSIQKDIRGLLQANFQELRLVENSSHSMPNFYALSIFLISNIDAVTKFDDLMMPICKLIDTDRVQADLPEDQDWYCVCSHKVTTEHLFGIENMETGFKLYVGSECIKNYKVISEQERKRMAQVARDRKLTPEEKFERLQKKEEKKEKQHKKEEAKREKQEIKKMKEEEKRSKEEEKRFKAEQKQKENEKIQELLRFKRQRFTEKSRLEQMKNLHNTAMKRKNALNVIKRHLQPYVNRWAAKIQHHFKLKSDALNIISRHFQRKVNVWKLNIRKKFQQKMRKIEDDLRELAEKKFQQKRQRIIDEIQKQQESENRKCLDCKMFTIPNQEPHYKTRCLECWKKQQKPSQSETEEATNRKCEACNICFSVKKNETWKTVCSNCYKKQMWQKNHKVRAQFQ